MKKVLRSGSVYMGTCGEPAGMMDSFGEPLFVGDLVDVYCEMPLRSGSSRNVNGPEYIVKGDDGELFVMGLKSSTGRLTEYYLDGEKADENNYDYSETYFVNDSYPETEPRWKWLVKKVKGYQDTVSGERWGSGNVTTYLEPDDGQDGVARKEVFA